MAFRQRLALVSLAIGLAAGPSSVSSAGPTLLLEVPSGRILYAEEMDDQWHPASLTKIMTAYVVFNALKSGRITLETPITYSEAAHAQPPSKIGLPVGATITIDLALQSVIVKSANDISVALAEAVGGSEARFVEMMNATARSIGMTRTRFVNPHGLPASEQVTTARDLARLAMAVTRDFPQYAHYWAQSQMQIGNVRIVSHNGLFKTLEGVDGMKTGFICDSGYNMVASATRDGVRLMAVVLGEMSAADRNTRAQALIEHGFATLGWKTLLGARDTVATMALAADAKDAASIRNSVVAMECSNRRMARAAQTARKRAKARSKAEAQRKAERPAKAATAGQKATGTPAAGGSAPAARTSAAAKATPAGAGPAPAPR
jgi:D-alanyl-D-alanine carboxypeptidase